MAGFEGLLDERFFILNPMKRIRHQYRINGLRKILCECPRIPVDRHYILDVLLIGECFEFIK
ncbi:hypothetical protein HAPAU_40540 [Halalkalicoccus paucihalophilus]|uniref:Uncharacterized protein n=1 Tax=Halalkalicoccus paucihalophilus TaxID=1008153 RepID=A0A151A8L1_9EURY|nr:hypothetical protein HAPAU_40540 [Halalkalicoccus paucihalophilus]